MAVLSPAEHVASREGRLAAEVDLPTGRTKRWGPDEASTADVLAGLSFTTSDPGGFKDTNFGLSRDIDLEWADLALLLPLKIYGAGGATAWEGRLQERPGRHGAEDQISPGAVGWQAHLADRQFQEIYLDSDATAWGDMPSQRKIVLNAATPTGAGPTLFCVEAESGDGEIAVPGIRFRLGSVLVNRTPVGEQWYYGNGIDIGQIVSQSRCISGSNPDPNFNTRSYYSKDSQAGVVAEAIPDTHLAGLGEYGAPDPGVGYKYAFAQMLYNISLGTNDYGNTWEMQYPKIIGRSGVQAIGAWPSIGIRASDAIANIVGRFAPKLNYTTGANGSIQPTEYPIPQLAFKTPIKPSDAIPAINAYHQYSWGVEDNRSFFFRPTTTHRKRWRIRRSRGDGVELLGPQAEAAVNGVVVTFTDAAGISRVVGPPQLSTAYTTSEALADTRPINPVNIVGGGQKWGELTLGFVTDIPGAIQIGAMWLGEQLSNASSRGSVTVTGVVEDEHGAYWPSWAMRAGDSATVVDGDKVERRIIETIYNADSRMVNCNLDATPHRLEAIMERMGIAVAGL